MRRNFTLCLLLAALFVLEHAIALHISPGHEPLLNTEFAQNINKLTDGQWVASENNGHLLHNISSEQARRLMGVWSMKSSAYPRIFSKEEEQMSIPAQFDSAERWPQCPTIQEIRDQSNCGSCWAIAAVEAISDRYCIVANKSDIRISTLNLLSCCFICGRGCNGGIPTMAWLWWVIHGLATESCQPYPFPSCAHHGSAGKYPSCPSEIYPTPSCNKTCSKTSEELVLLKGKSFYTLGSEEAYQRELMINGPFEVALSIYEDFLLYKSGVYSHKTGSFLGGHAVRLVGWGVENGVKYWRVANSWNDDWGENGYFRILRGTNECGIEESGVAGLP